MLVPKRSATCGDSTVRLSIDWGSLLAHIVFLERRSPGGWLECGIRAVLLLGEPPGIKGSAPRRIVATREVNSLGVWRQFCTFANYFLGVSGRPQRCMGFPSRSCPLLNLPENGDFRTAVQGRQQQQLAAPEQGAQPTMTPSNCRGNRIAANGGLIALQIRSTRPATIHHNAIAAMPGSQPMIRDGPTKMI